jgi:hypothetical protein
MKGEAIQVALTDWNKNLIYDRHLAACKDWQSLLYWAWGDYVQIICSLYKYMDSTVAPCCWIRPTLCICTKFNQCISPFSNFFPSVAKSGSSRGLILMVYDWHRVLIWNKSGLIMMNMYYSFLDTLIVESICAGLLTDLCTNFCMWKRTGKWYISMIQIESFSSLNQQSFMPKQEQKWHQNSWIQKSANAQSRLDPLAKLHIVKNPKP